VPDFTLIRPEGRLISEHQFDETTGQFHCHVSSTIDPRILRPFLGEGLQRGFDLFILTRPPELEFEIWGRTDDAQRIGVEARSALPILRFAAKASLRFRRKCFTQIGTLGLSRPGLNWDPGWFRLMG
jgi:hypothetical protein